MGETYSCESKFFFTSFIQCFSCILLLSIFCIVSIVCIVSKIVSLSGLANNSIQLVLRIS